jgi:hypothetical protein
MEFFQQPFQPVLDAFVAGEIGEAELLRQTEYFERWRYDYRLYRPILRFAREHGIPLIALNVPKEITDKVGDGGIESLTERAAQIPAEIDRDDDGYRDRVKAVFDMHPKGEDADFEHFLDVQLLWDEGMAERAASYVKGEPGQDPGGARRRPATSSTASGIPSGCSAGSTCPRRPSSSGAMRPFDPDMADFVLFPQRVSCRHRAARRHARHRVRGRGDRRAGLQRGQRRQGRRRGGGGSHRQRRREPHRQLRRHPHRADGQRPGETLPVEVLRKPCSASRSGCPSTWSCIDAG